MILAKRPEIERFLKAPDPAIRAIVETWPEAFATERALALGFEGDASFDALVALHIAETGL